MATDFQFRYDPAKSVDADDLRLGEIVASLSHALDITEGQPVGHCIRACWIGFHIGQELNLSGQELSDLYYTILLKDLGCSSNAARICELYLADDITFKHDFKSIDGSLSAALRFVFAKTGLETGLSERIRAIVNILQNGGDISHELIETRCHRGADIAAKMRFSDKVQVGIRSLDERWDGSGKPEKLAGDAIPLNANIALLAQVADVFHNQHGRQAAIDEINSRSDTWFSPALVEAFLTVAARDDIWSMLRSNKIDEAVFALEPEGGTVTMTEDYLDDIAAAYADVVDAKSPYTADHSNRVTLYSDIIAEELGLCEKHRRWLRRAALLHDVGKLGVSNQILDKPGKLDDDEWTAIRAHPRNSEVILQQVSAFIDIAPVAGAHHERLDGKGYPYQLAGNDICGEVRILTVADVFDALTADRPYRKAMPIGDAFAILERDIGSAFDGRCVTALKAGFERLNADAA